MIHAISTCDECGRAFMDNPEAPRLWCSAYCETQPARFAATEARGAAAERAAVVAYLRTRPSYGPIADAIERGEHRR